VKNPVTALAGAMALATVTLTLTACGESKSPAAAGVAASSHAEQIAALEARVDRIKDSNDIKRLQREYGYYLDKGQYEQLADLFAPEASVECHWASTDVSAIGTMNWASPSVLERAV